MAHSGALWVPFPSLLPCPCPCLCFPLSGPQCSVGVMEAQGGVCGPGWSPAVLGPALTCGALGVSSSLTLFARCPCAGPSLCLSSGEKVGVRRWEQSRTSALVEVGFGCLGASAGTGGIQSTRVRQGHMGIALQLPRRATWWHCCGWQTDVSASLCPALSFYFVLLCAALDSSGVQIRHISSFRWTAQ